MPLLLLLVNLRIKRLTEGVRIEFGGRQLLSALLSLIGNILILLDGLLCLVLFLCALLLFCDQCTKLNVVVLFDTFTYLFGVARVVGFVHPALLFHELSSEVGGALTRIDKLRWSLSFIVPGVTQILYVVIALIIR